MSTLARIRRQNRRGFNMRLRYNEGADRQGAYWKAIDIHLIPDNIKYGNEFDFWCQIRHGIYLLRIIKSSQKGYFINKTKGKGHIIYLIVELDFNIIDDRLISDIIRKFSQIGIPKYTFKRIYIAHTNKT